MSHPLMPCILWMKKSGDNESCVGKQKSNKSTRDQNGAGEREGETKTVPFKKPQSLTLSARASFCDSAAASQWASFHCAARITFLAAAQVRAFFVPVRRPSPRHISMGPYRVCLEQIRPRPGNGLPSSEREFAAAH